MKNISIAVPSPRSPPNAQNAIDPVATQELSCRLGLSKKEQK
jgi:hypothetical protein